MSDNASELEPDAPAFVRWSPRHGPTVGDHIGQPPGLGAGVALGMLMSAAGAVAVGALAIGALAIGALAIGRLVVGKARVGHLRVDRLEVGDLVVLHRR